MDRVAVESLGFNGLVEREWLVANGLGGFSSSTICGMNTRKYHGLLVAAMAPPVRRMVILSRIDELVYSPSGPVELSTNEYPYTIHPEGFKHLRAFSPDPFPRWAFQSDGFTLEKSVRLLPGENTVCIAYTLLAGDKPVDLELRPLLALRPIHELMYQWNGRLKAEYRDRGRIRIAAAAKTPEVFLAHDGEFVDAQVWYLNTIYRREQERGYAGLEDLWMPGVLRRTLAPGETFHVVCSTEKIDFAQILRQVHAPPAARTAPNGGDAVSADLAHAGEPHVLNVAGEIPAQRKTYIATHYPWSSPSVRGEMISLAGLLLVPGHFDQARNLLESRLTLLDRGVLPSLLPEDSSPPVYQGADTSLWFINAVHQYFTYTGDEAAARNLLDGLDEIIECYRRGTHLGIAADADGLISTGSPDMPTTWMDATLVDHIVTPRRGRPVEINALWHSALRTVAALHTQLGRSDRATELTDLADSVRQSFNRRFWNAEAGCLYDVVEDHLLDASVRPNQVFAVSLPFPVLWEEHRAEVIDTIINELLTPYGLRTLSPRDSAYQGRYRGDVVLRDRAYHQGSAYPWLLGPLVSAIIKTRGRADAVLSLARQIVAPIQSHIRGPGLGLVAELFDGDAPHRPGGAIASAPAAGELARCWTEDVLGILPPQRPKPKKENPSPLAAQA